MEGLGEARGEGAAEVEDERGRSSSLRLPICGVGGVELFAKDAAIISFCDTVDAFSTYAT